MQKLVKITFVECEADKSYLWSLLRKHIEGESLKQIQDIFDQSEGMILLKDLYKHCQPNDEFDLKHLQVAATTYSIWKAYIEMWKFADRWFIKDYPLESHNNGLIDLILEKVNGSHPSLFMYKDKTDDFYEYLTVLKVGKFSEEEVKGIVDHAEYKLESQTLATN